REVEVVLAFDLVRIGNRIIHLYREAVGVQLIDDIGDFGVTGVGHVFLKSHAEDGDRGGPVLPFQQATNAFARDPLPDAVIDLSAGQNHLRFVTRLLGAIGQIIGIDADAVTPDQAGGELLEVPFGAGGGKHIASIDTKTFE